ncbi:MAG: sulfatase [Planctomycetota bacterium]
MKRREFNKAIGLYAATAGITSTSARAANPPPTDQPGRRPNLLYIFPDQYRLHALSLWRAPAFQHAIRGVSDPVETPHLDALARESVVLNQACSTHPVCSPHRAMLMSGMYPRQNGVMHMNCKAGRTQGLKHGITCFTDVLAAEGYETAYVGKTHWERTEPLFDKENRYVGTAEEPGGHYANPFDTYIPPGPGRRGNRYWFQNIGDRHKDPLSYSNRPELVDGKPDGHPHRFRRFTPTQEADIAVDYLKNESGQRDASKPFSLIWSPNPPHNPYSDVDRDCDRAVYEALYADMPLEEALNRPNVAPTKDNLAERAARIYYALVSSIDQQVGRVLQALKESGQADNTLVVFTSDHGELLGSHGKMGKNLIYDESFLVPYLIRFPGVLQPRIDDLLLGSVDIMPTMLSLLGLSQSIPDTVQGFDYASGLRDGVYTEAPKPRSALYLNGRNKKGVRTDRYTYLVHADDKPELYDNTADPYQTTSISLDEVDQSEIQTLKDELGRWLVRANDEWCDTQKRSDLINYPS